MIENFTELQERVRSSEPLVASVTQAADQGALLSVKAAADQGFIEPMLTGDRGRVEESRDHIRPKPLEILQAGTEEETVERAVRAIHNGGTQVLTKGPVNTSVYMRGILSREWRFRTGRLLSMMAVCEALGYHRLLLCSGSGINVAPNLEQKKGILESLPYTVRDMGIRNPKVAVLAASGVVDPKVVSTMDVTGLVGAVKNEEGFLPCIIEGPVVSDVVFDPKSAAHKKIDGRVTGDVDLVIFPSIEADNITGKLWIHLCRSPWSGIVPGASSPVIPGSRSDTAEIKLSSVALACLAAQSGRQTGGVIISNSKVSITGKQFLIVFFVGLISAVTYATPFVQYVFYDDLAGALHTTNTQLGFLITISGIGNLLMPFGGTSSDKFNIKKVYLLGMFITCALNSLLTMSMSYTFTIFIWAGLAVTGLILYFPIHAELVRPVRDEESRGTIFGFAESACGLASAIINFTALDLYTKVAVGAMGGVAGLKATTISYGVVEFIATITLVLLLPDPEKVGKGQDGGGSDQETKLSMKGWVGMLKDPCTWSADITVFAAYSTYQIPSYFTPYFTDVLGAAAIGPGAVAITRTYGIRIVGAPPGGCMKDRIRSVPSIIAAVLARGAVITLIFMFMPTGVPSILLTVITLVISFMVHIVRGAMLAVPSKVKIPKRYATSTAGVVYTIGFCPDLFQVAMYDHWLDTYGSARYTRVFIYIIVIMVVGAANGTAAVVCEKKHAATDLIPVEGGTEVAQAQ